MKTQRKVLSLVLCVSLLLGCLAVAGVSAAAEEITWSDATLGQWARLNADSTILGETNRLVGIHPTDSTGTSQRGLKDGTTLPSSTDGLLGDKNNSTTTQTFFNAGWGSWLQLTYDLGGLYSLQDFVYAGTTESVRYTAHLIHIYVSTSLADLYTEANLVVKAEKFDVNYVYWQFKADKAKIGKYVGFEVYNADGTKSEADEPNAFLDGNRISSSTWGKVIVGEIGAYGEEVDALWGDATLGQWAAISANDKILKQPNLLSGITPTKDTRPDSFALGRGTWDLITDNALSVKANYTNTSISVTGLWGNAWRELTFATDKVYHYEYFVFGGSDEGANYTPHSIKIYVGNDLNTLYTDANLVVNADRFDVTGQHWKFKPDGVACGKYVGYSMYVPEYYPGTDTEETKPLCYKDGTAIYANWYGQLRIGEIGAYGGAVEAPVANLGGQIRNPEATDNYALRFGFSMDMTGVGYADTDPKASGNYTRAIAEDATVTIDGIAYDVADFGVLLSTAVSEDLTMADVDDSMTQKVPAANLYDVADGTVTFTAVVVDIPAAYKDAAIYARPYVELDDGNVLYGEMISRSVSTVTDSMA